MRTGWLGTMSEPAEALEAPGLKAELGAVFGGRFFRHKNIAEFTSTKLGGTVEYLVIAESTQELIEAARAAYKYQVPFVVVGGGSGILASDVGYPGLVIINKAERLLYDTTRNQAVVDSGVVIDRLLNNAAAKGLGGLEFLAAVPGTIGGAVATNAGFAGRAIKSVIKELVIFVPGNDGGQVITVGGEEITAEPYEQLFPETIAGGIGAGKIFSQTPVVLTVRLQFSLTDQVEILRRLSAVRRTVSARPNGQRLGWVFRQELAALTIERGQLASLRKLGVLVDLKTGTIARQKERANAATLRAVIARIKALGQEAGIALDERLHFLGYWPSDNEIADE